MTRLSDEMIGALQHHAGYVRTCGRAYARYGTLRALMLRGLLDEMYCPTEEGRVWLAEHHPELKLRCQMFATMCDKPATGTTTGTPNYPPVGAQVPSCDGHHYNATGQRRPTPAASNIEASARCPNGCGEVTWAMDRYHCRSCGNEWSLEVIHDAPTNGVVA